MALTGIPRPAVDEDSGIMAPVEPRVQYESAIRVASA
jgi:hypothetical protein